MAPLTTTAAPAIRTTVPVEVRSKSDAGVKVSSGLEMQRVRWSGGVAGGEGGDGE